MSTSLGKLILSASLIVPVNFCNLHTLEFCRVLEKNHVFHQEDKKEQRFERVNVNLWQSRSWMEKVLMSHNFIMYMPSRSLKFHVTQVVVTICYALFLQVVRLHLLITVKESAINVPMNLDARRRITFFANSLFMTMPSAPKVRNMLSFRLVLVKGLVW